VKAETLAVVLAGCETREELEVWDAAFSVALGLSWGAREALREARGLAQGRLLRLSGVAEASRGEVDACRVFRPGLPRGGCFGDGQPRCAGCVHFER
jgi:hypothetical protein